MPLTLLDKAGDRNLSITERTNALYQFLRAQDEDDERKLYRAKLSIIKRANVLYQELRALPNFKELRPLYSENGVEGIIPYSRATMARYRKIFKVEGMMERIMTDDTWTLAELEKYTWKDSIDLVTLKVSKKPRTHRDA